MSHPAPHLYIFLGAFAYVLIILKFCLGFQGLCGYICHLYDFSRFHARMSFWDKSPDIRLMQRADSYYCWILSTKLFVGIQNPASTLYSSDEVSLHSWVENKIISSFSLISLFLSVEILNTSGNLKLNTRQRLNKPLFSQHLKSDNNNINNKSVCQLNL